MLTLYGFAAAGAAAAAVSVSGFAAAAVSVSFFCSCWRCSWRLLLLIIFAGMVFSLVNMERGSEALLESCAERKK